MESFGYYAKLKPSKTIQHELNERKKLNSISKSFYTVLFWHVGTIQIQTESLM